MTNEKKKFHNYTCSGIINGRRATVTLKALSHANAEKQFKERYPFDTLHQCKEV